jgi:hypothetical protein
MIFITTKLENIIIETVTKTLQQHVTNIKAEPKMYTRKEAASSSRITLPTLRVYEVQGRLIPKRAGKSVRCTKEILEHLSLHYDRSHEQF